jgi:DNA-binding NarL/FixJ family response regulator
MGAKFPGLNIGAAPLAGQRALVIDDQELSRSVIVTMLREMGVAHPVSARTPEEAKRTLAQAAQPFDLIISEFHFLRAGVSATGQDLLDELRQARGLPMRCAFLMVTDEARSPLVADAIEGALDDYIIKPFTAAAFEERLLAVLARKEALREVFTEIEAQRYPEAAARCNALFRAGGPYRVYAARIGSELYLLLADYPAATRMLDELLKIKALPWARLGLAKIQLATAPPAQACRSLETLLAENPAYADAYDIYGRALVEAMDFDGALKVYERALQLTPGNISRLQKLGMMCLHQDRCAEAVRHLGRALNLGAESRALDYQALVALGIASLDVKTPSGWERGLPLIEAALRAHPGSYRLATLKTLMNATAELEQARPAGCAALLGRLARELRASGFDFEMACALLHLLGRLSAGQAVAEAQAWARVIGQRFASSAPRGKLLELAAARVSGLPEVIKEAAEVVNAGTKQAMEQVVQGAPEQGLAALLELARSSLNARVIGVAQRSLERHADKLGPERARPFETALMQLQAEFGSTGQGAPRPRAGQ